MLKLNDNQLAEVKLLFEASEYVPVIIHIIKVELPLVQKKLELMKKALEVDCNFYFGEVRSLGIYVGIKSSQPPLEIIKEKKARQKFSNEYMIAQEIYDRFGVNDWTVLPENVNAKHVLITMMNKAKSRNEFNKYGMKKTSDGMKIFRKFHFMEPQKLKERVGKQITLEYKVEEDEFDLEA
jgi:hypothetical protein